MRNRRAALRFAPRCSASLRSKSVVCGCLPNLLYLKKFVKYVLARRAINRSLCVRLLCSAPPFQSVGTPSVFGTASSFGNFSSLKNKQLHSCAWSLGSFTRALHLFGCATLSVLSFAPLSLQHNTATAPRNFADAFRGFSTRYRYAYG